MKDVAALGAWRNLDRRARRRRRHGDFRTEHELRIGDEYLGVELLTIAFEPRVVRDLEENVNVAARPLTLTCVADAAQRHVLPGRHSRRDVDRDLAIVSHPPLAFALLADRLDHAPLRLARRARRDR